MFSYNMLKIINKIVVLLLYEIMTNENIFKKYFNLNFGKLFV